MAFQSATRLPFDGIRTNSVYGRTNLVTIRNMARPYDDPLPEWIKQAEASAEFSRLVETIIEMRLQNKPVIWSMGAHVIKNGLSRYMIEMVRHGFLTHVSGNGATSIHDFELALLGETSEDVARSIEDGSFGMWEETGRMMNEAIQAGSAAGLGYGQSLYRYITEHTDRFPFVEDCVVVQCQRYGIPYTCHISIGTDIIHQHPIVNFEALGAASGIDFITMCSSIAKMDDGGVYLNFGSAISGPELLLKGLTIARNRGLGMKNIVAANFDIVPVPANDSPHADQPEFHYRPRRIFLDHLNEIEGTGYLFRGLHQVTIPHLFHRLLHIKQERELKFPGAPASLAPVYPNPPKLYSLSSGTELTTPMRLDAIRGQEYWNAPGFMELVSRVRIAKEQNCGILAFFGGNVIDSGVSPMIIDLIERGYITHVALNGCSCTSDVELAAFGYAGKRNTGTLREGNLGVRRETGDVIHQALVEGAPSQLGFGESLMAYAGSNPEKFPHIQDSLLGACMSKGIPYTVHITIGIDDIHLHPKTDFAILGRASGYDFQAYCFTVSRLEGGVFMNFGSTVTGPEVFLKALSIARNLQYPVRTITTANFDLVRLGDYNRKVGYEDWDYYYRPRKNIVHRPTSLGGKGFHFEGQHQETIPALWNALLQTT